MLLGAFVTVYNYISYRLMAPPYGLGQSAVGFIFSVYPVGMLSSTWMGHLAGRLGRRKLVWAMFVIMLAGLLLTMLRLSMAHRRRHRGIYLRLFRRPLDREQLGGPPRGERQGTGVLDVSFCVLPGVEHRGCRGRTVLRGASGWPGVVSFVALLLGLGLLFAWRLFHLTPLPPAQSPGAEPSLP